MLHFVDVGVYLGRTSRKLLQMSNSPDLRVYMFEPNPAYAARLRKVFAKEPRALVYEEALSDCDGFCDFFIPQSGLKMKGQLGSLVRSQTMKKAHWEVNTHKVKLRSARKFIKGLSKGKVVLYSNCEGGEYDVIRDLFSDDTWKRIYLWSVDIHEYETETSKQAVKFIEDTFASHDITNLAAHWGRRSERRVRRFLRRHIMPLVTS